MGRNKQQGHEGAKDGQAAFGLTRIDLSRLTRREKQALVLWAILEDQMTDARLDSMVDVIKSSSVDGGPSGGLF